MNPLDTFVAAFQRALRAQDMKRVTELIQDPRYKDIKATELDSVLENYLDYFQDRKLLDYFIAHPHFNHISPSILAHFLVTSFRLDHPEASLKLFNHPQFKSLSPLQIEQVSLAALEFQGRRIIGQLIQRPAFKQVFDRHLDALIFCAIRNNDREWIEQLFKYPQYPTVSTQVFQSLMRWALQRRDKVLMSLIIRHQTFNERIESQLRLELFNAFLENEKDKKLNIEKHLIEQLSKHPGYPRFSPHMLTWLFDRAINDKDQMLFSRLLRHPQFESIPGDSLADLLSQTLSSSNKSQFKALMTHPNFAHISAGKLGLILEEAIRLDDKEILNVLLQHEQFKNIPEDSFKRVILTKIGSLNQGSIQEFLNDPLFKEKCQALIFEAIRRNELDLIDPFFRNSILKSHVVHQFIKYVKIGDPFVNHYVIRDILRQAFLTHDHSLIEVLARNPLFHSNIRQLMLQSIQFDDDKLIESFLLDSLLKGPFKRIIQQSSQTDKQRLFNIFISQPNFSQKLQNVRQEIQSWNLPSSQETP